MFVRPQGFTQCVFVCNIYINKRNVYKINLQCAFKLCNGCAVCNKIQHTQIFSIHMIKQLIFECTVVHLFQNAMQKGEALFAVRKIFNFETLGNKQCIFWFLFVMYCTNFLR